MGILVGAVIVFCFYCSVIGKMMTVFLIGSFCSVLFIIYGLLNCTVILKTIIYLNLLFPLGI